MNVWRNQPEILTNYTPLHKDISFFKFLGFVLSRSLIEDELFFVKKKTSLDFYWLNNRGSPMQKGGLSKTIN